MAESVIDADAGCLSTADLLRAEIYPDSDDVADPLGNGVDGVYDRVEYKYNRQGERIEKKDQNGTVHVYQFDALGRALHDRVTTLGAGIDGAVRRISTTYEARGMVEKVTSYDSATVGSGNVVNEVVHEYSDLGLLVKEFQEHEGAQDGNTPYAQHNVDESANDGKFTNALRPSSVRYPNGRLVHFTYGSADGVADVLNRLDAIQDDSGGNPGDVLASYSYLGLGTIVIEDYQQPDVRLVERAIAGCYNAIPSAPRGVARPAARPLSLRDVQNSLGRALSEAVPKNLSDPGAFDNIAAKQSNLIKERIHAEFPGTPPLTFMATSFERDLQKSFEPARDEIPRPTR